MLKDSDAIFKEAINFLRQKGFNEVIIAASVIGENGSLSCAYTIEASIHFTSTIIQCLSYEIGGNISNASKH